MVPVFGEEGLNEPAAAVQVLQIVVAGRAHERRRCTRRSRQYAYKAHNTRVGDLASAKAVSLAPASGRARLKTELAAVKSHPNGAEESTTTTDQDGKTYVGNGQHRRRHQATATTSSTTTTQLDVHSRPKK